MRDCESCDGYGKVDDETCPDCGGEGVSETMCDACGGEGTYEGLECPHCDGTGNLEGY